MSLMIAVASVCCRAIASILPSSSSIDWVFKMPTFITTLRLVPAKSELCRRKAAMPTRNVPCRRVEESPGDWQQCQRRQQPRTGEHQPVQPRGVNEMFSRQQISIDVAHRSRGTAPARATFSLGASRGGVLNRDLGGPNLCTRHETPPGTRCAPRSRCC